MTSNNRAMERGSRWMRAGRWAALAVALLLATPAVAYSKGKKKEEEAAPTKSYVLPYMIVMAFLGIGLMTVCRPSKRKDKPDDKPLNEQE